MSERYVVNSHVDGDALFIYERESPALLRPMYEDEVRVLLNNMADDPESEADDDE